jgi:hypothetical protein
MSCLYIALNLKKVKANSKTNWKLDKKKTPELLPGLKQRESADAREK